MTEAEWLACEKPLPMLEFLHGRANARKLRLLACACCRRIWNLLRDERSRNAVEVAERYSDGKATELELLYASDAAYGKACSDAFLEDSRTLSRPTSSPYDADVAAANAAWPDISSTIAFVVDVTTIAMNANAAKCKDAMRYDERAVQCDLLRDIFGNPFRAGTLDPEWLAWQDGTILKLAQSIYEERAFDHLPILADALEEAGCTNTDILDHCRQPGEHVCGCWVIDLILGKS